MQIFLMTKELVFENCRFGRLSRTTQDNDLKFPPFLQQTLAQPIPCFFARIFFFSHFKLF
jgi:hypothetical protein